MLASSIPSIDRFLGLNNVSDPVRLPVGWLQQADNVDVTDTGALVKRTGYTLAASGSMTSAYATLDEERMYVVDGTQIKAMAGAVVGPALVFGLGSARMYWAEMNDAVFYNNGTDRGIIQPDNQVMSWAWPVLGTPTVAAVTGSLPAGTYRACCTFTLADGRETGAGEQAVIPLATGQALQFSGLPTAPGCITNTYIAPADSTVLQLARSGATAFVWGAGADSLGADLLTENLDPLPPGTDVIQAWRGRMYAAQYFAADNQTAIWFSQPLGFHLFNLNEDFVIVPGQVRMLAPTDGALIVATEDRIYAYTPERLAVLAAYGVVPGQHWAREDDGSIVFWSTRGMCAALPFKNLTARQVSVAPGLSAGGAVMRKDGQTRYVVAIQQGGTAYNSR